jgi:ATP-dependent protease HslVU (ClpYQ) peptidase subunit
MTTVLADRKLGVMIADSNVSDGERQWRARKVFRSGDALLGFAGPVSEWTEFQAWFKGGMETLRPKSTELHVLMLRSDGLFYFGTGAELPERISSGREAIGTGAMAAMAAYEATGWTDPRRAVQIACRHDAASRPPVRTYHL